MTSKRGEIIKKDILSVLTTTLIVAVSTMLTEIINLIPNWGLDKLEIWALTGLFTFLLDLAKKYAKVTTY